MVSKLNLAVAGVAIVAFLALGGASGIGSRIGGGLASFSNSLLDSIRGGFDSLNPFNVTVPIEDFPELSIAPQGERVAPGTGTEFTSKRAFELTFANGSRIERSFEPSPALGGSRDIAGIRGKPLAQTAISRTQPTFTGVLTTSVGGSRAIAGSAALFDRLRNNLRTNANKSVTQAKLNTAVAVSEPTNTRRFG